MKKICAYRGENLFIGLDGNFYEYAGRGEYLKVDFLNVEAWKADIDLYCQTIKS